MASLETPIKTMFADMDGERKAVIERAELNAEFTVPSILPDANSKEKDGLKKNYASMGAVGVKHIVNKLALTLLPSNTSFFKLDMADDLKDDEEDDSEILEGFNNTERKTLKYINTSGIRVPFYQTLTSLVVAGNSLMYIPSTTKLKEKIKVFKLHNYVVERDAFGNILKIITKEIMSSNTIPLDIRDMVISKFTDDVPSEIELYTMINLTEDGKGWELRQEIEEEIFNEDLNVALDDSPFICLRWSAISGENYGRAFIDDLLQILKL